jgi:flagellar M-ring protein FliF
MNTAVVEAGQPGAKVTLVPGGFMGLDTSQKIKLAAGAIVLIALLALSFVWGRQPEWRVLYSNLSDKDGGAVVAQLSTMNIPYKHSEGGNAILVPADRVHDTRLRLATQGLPKGSVTGFELMDNSRFGITQFQERLNFQRGLEGELTRSIQALSSVESARVHLALPNQNGFIREQQKPSASVLLTLHAGRTLDRAQLAGIVHLISSSVPDMSPKAVSILDDTGALLSDAGDGTGGAVDAQQLQYVQQIEQSYNRRIMDILEPIVGRANVRAQVSADVDFSQSESTSEQHRPNQGAEPGAVRSQQISETVAGSNSPGVPGVPGAASNQPQVAATAPVNGSATVLQTAGAAAGAAAGNRRDSVVNYEVDKTVKVVRNATGSIKRLSAAVLLNYREEKDAAGKVTQVAMTPEQITQMTALVRETIGFNKDRGDSVNLVNASFTKAPVAAPVEVPLWRQPEVVDMARSSLWPIGIALTALIVLLGFVRPALKSMKAQRAVTGTRLNTVIEGNEQLPGLTNAAANANQGLPAPTIEDIRLADAKILALEKPMAVANIVKTWVHGDAAG